MAGWSVVLNGVSVNGGDTVPIDTTDVGCLEIPPEGLDVPELRIEDVTFPQRDGVEHFSDWYNSRIVTLARVSVQQDSCTSCISAAQKMAMLAGAWSRHCDDTELVIFTDCHDEDAPDAERAFIGPFGVVGRPRVANYTWLPGDRRIGVATLRFDGVDHRLYILDADGTPGSGVQCLDLDPVIAARCRTYPRCYPSGVSCYTVESPSVTGVTPTETDNFGTLCAPLIITLTGPLTSPSVENLATGETVTYEGVIGDGQTVTIDTTTGEAFDQDGIARTYLLSGDTRMQLAVGVNVLRLLSRGSGDSGFASVCYRPAVLTG